VIPGSGTRGEEERFLSAQADPFPTGAGIEDHRSERARKSRPAPFEMTVAGCERTGGEDGWDIDFLTRTCGRHILSCREIAKMSNSSQQETTR
jgi:hypothetical protein